MKRARAVIFFIFMFLGIIGCSEHAKIDEIQDLNEVKHTILFIYSDTNAAYDYTFNGSYIDNKGNVYDFDFSDQGFDDYIFKVGLPNYLAAMDGNELIGTVDKNELLKYYNMLLKVNVDAKKKTKPGACDMGTQVWEGVLGNDDETMRTILIYSTGDDESYNTDKYAKKIARWLNNRPIDFLNKETE